MKTISLFIFLIAGLLVGACKRQLNVFPTTAEVDGNIIKDEQTAQTALNGVYFRFACAGDDFIANTTGTKWMNPNEVIPSILSGVSNWPVSSNPFNSANLSPDSYGMDFDWLYGYALVNAANGFIGNLAPASNVPAAAKQQMMAEAKFLRAFGHSELLLYYGQYNDPSSKYGVILRETALTPTNINQPRSDVAAVYTSMLSDLDEAIKGLPVLNKTNYYANASAARMLKARVLMNRGAAGDYAQVINLANEVITNGPFVLEDSLKDIFLTKGLNSKEVVLGIQPYPKESYKFDYYQHIRQFSVSDSLVSLLANDGRSQWVYKTINYFGTTHTMTKYYSGDPMDPVQTPLSTYCYAFRLTEAYLLEAEALVMSGGDLARARDLLTTVMGHAGAGVQELATVANATMPAALQLEIVKEYLRNFLFENGLDWFALRRLPFATLQSLNPNYTDKRRLILPIPNTELIKNKVIQNPGY